MRKIQSQILSRNYYLIPDTKRRPLKIYVTNKFWEIEFDYLFLKFKSKILYSSFDINVCNIQW